MRTDIDYIISLMKEYTPKLEGELDEQDEAPAGGGASAPSTGGGGGNTNARGRLWGTGLNRGPANMLGLKGEKWGSGVARGHANPVP